MSQQQVTLPTVLDQKLLIVADYQRPYAWQDKQLMDLWEDLDLLGKGKRHYAGTLVLKPTVEQPLVTNTGEHLLPHEVVDGQQRLTTCLILLDRVRRRLAGLAMNGHEDAGEVSESLHRQYAVVKVGGVPCGRLRLAKELDEVWLRSILGDQQVAVTGEVLGVVRLRRAAEFFDEQLEGLVGGVSDEVAFARLSDLIGRVTFGLQFLVYDVQSEAEVGVIFETLNERGLNLSELDKVKNYLLYLARQLPNDQKRSLVDTINDKWALIFHNLAEIPEIAEEVLRAHWLATRDPAPRSWKRTRSVKERVPRSRYVEGSERLVSAPDGQLTDADDVLDVLYNEVKTYVEELEQCSVFASEMYRENSPYSGFANERERIRAATSSLVRSGIIAIFRPLLFACRLRHPQDGLLYADLIELCLKYSVRVFLISQRRGNAGEPYLCKIAFDLYEGTDPDTCIARVRDRLWSYAPDDLVRERLRSPDNWYARTDAHKFLLYEYELWLAKSPAGVPDYRTFFDSRHGKSTEHILPQNPPRDDDPAKNSEWWDVFTDQEHQRLCNTLGNLVLTNGDSNSSYGTKRFSDKRGTPLQDEPCYFNGKLHQERKVAKTYEEWTPDSILERQAILADWIMARWSVEPPSFRAVRDVDEQAANVDESGNAGSSEELSWMKAREGLT